MAMTKERKSQIDHLVVKKLFREKFNFSTDIKRRIPNTAKEFGISNEEAEEYLKIYVHELADEFFKK